MPQSDAKLETSLNAASASRSQGGGPAPRNRLLEPSDKPGPSKPVHGAHQSGLYIVATPIGNARDITLRALDILHAADIVACEDTRVSRKLFRIYGIESAELVSYHEHNAQKMRPRLIGRLKDGAIVALISDAGTPMINDPGYRLSAECRDAGIPVFALPGASSVLAALVSAGLPTDRFSFLGFPPNKPGKRRQFLDELAPLAGTLVFLESPNRLASTLADMALVFGARDAVVTRELTKKFEEIRRGSLDQLAQHYAAAGAPKGEVTLVVAGRPGEQPVASEDDVDALLAEALTRMSLKEAATAVAAATGRPRRDIYGRALKLKPEQPD